MAMAMPAPTSSLLCNLCDSCHDQRFLLKHLRDHHENEPNFQVICTLCSESFKKWSSFKKHLQRKHKGNLTKNCVGRCTMFNCYVDTECGSDDIPDADDDAHQSQSDDEMDIAIGQEWESARFLLKSTEEFSLTHNGVDRFCECIQSFVDNVCSQISKNIDSQLPESLPLKQSIVASCQPGDLFKGLTTRYKREKYYVDTFDYVVRIPPV